MIWLAIATALLAVATGEITHRLTMARAFMLTGLFWGLLAASAVSHHLTLWGLAGVIVAASLVMAAWITYRERQAEQ